MPRPTNNAALHPSRNSTRHPHPKKKESDTPMPEGQTTTKFRTSISARALSIALMLALGLSTPFGQAFADESDYDQNRFIEGTSEPIEYTGPDISDVKSTEDEEDLSDPEPEPKIPSEESLDNQGLELETEDAGYSLTDYGIEYPTEGYVVVDHQDLTDGSESSSELSALSSVTPSATTNSWKAKKGQTIAVTNLGGATRFETNAEIVKASYSTADTVILASAENFPDALSGATLSGILDAPIVLVGKSSLAPSAAATIKAIGAKNVIVLGSTKAISDNTYNAAKKLVSNPSACVRLGGSDRYATNAAIYTYMTETLGYSFSNEILLATGSNFADALSASGYAAYAKVPIILTGNSGIDKSLQSKLKNFSGRTSILGSTYAVSDSQANWFSKATKNRLGGATRFETSKIIADYAVKQGLSAKGIIIATGQNFPDALSGAQLGNTKIAPILLVNSAIYGLQSSEAAYSYLSNHDADITDIFYLGSNYAVSDSKRTGIKALLAAVPTFTITWNGFDIINPNTGIITTNAAITQSYSQGANIKAPKFSFNFNSPVTGPVSKATYDVPQRQDGSYAFAGWNRSYSTATGNMTITATWKKVIMFDYDGITPSKAWPTGAEVAAYRNSTSTVSWNKNTWSLAYKGEKQNYGGYTAASLAQMKNNASWHSNVWRQMKASSTAVGGYLIEYYILDSQG